MSENENEVLETEVVENEAGEVMFDPLAEISDEEALAALESLAEEVVEVNTLEADAELEVQTPAAVGRVARHDSNLTSRAQRKNRQRGR